MNLVSVLNVSLYPVSNHSSPELSCKAAALASRINAGEDALLVFEVEMSSEVAVRRKTEDFSLNR